MSDTENTTPPGPEPAGWLSALLSAGGRAFDRLIGGLNALGTGWIFVMMMLITADVFFRFVFNAPIRGVPLIITMSIIAIVFLQLADALRAGRMTRSDMLITRLLKNNPVVGHSLQAIYHLAGVFIMTVLLWHSVPLLEKAWRLGTYDGTDGEFTLPEWPVKFIIVLGATVCSLQFLRLLWKDIEFHLKRRAG